MKKPKLAVWKFASCDGCQLSLLDCEDEILDIANLITIANFPEASRKIIKGPYDISLVEGSITTQHDIERIIEIRKISKVLITIGACATSGGIQALKNLSNVQEFISIVYANPEYIHTLDKSSPISDFVKVDFELRGCPISKEQLVELINAFLNKRKPNISSYSICTECKLKENICVMVSHKIPCLGPITHAGCNALCPSFNRGCFGCFGPMETPNTHSLSKKLEELGVSNEDIVRAYRTFNANSEEFKKESMNYGSKKK